MSRHDRLPAFVLGLGLWIVVVALCAPGPASAAPHKCRAGLDYTETSAACANILNCGIGDTCDEETTCSEDLGYKACLEGDTENLFCCGGCSCPTYQGAAAQCREFVGDAGVGPGFCLYPTLFDYCGDPATLSFAQLEACYTLPGGGRTRAYQEGDCDGDGVANGDDCVPCVDGTTCPVDAGPVDAAAPDAEGDGGFDDNPSSDGGGASDGGSAAGASDDDGGCGCKVGGAARTTSSALAAALALLALGLAVLRRLR